MSTPGKQNDFGTILTAIVTPFRADGSVDFKAFKALARYLVEHGSEGLVVTGSTGEGTTLSDREKLMLYYAAVEEVGERATVIAATGTYDTRHSTHLTAQAAEFVDGFLIVTPYYSKPPARGIVEHFKTIADVTEKSAACSAVWLAPMPNNSLKLMPVVPRCVVSLLTWS